MDCLLLASPQERAIAIIRMQVSAPRTHHPAPNGQIASRAKSRSGNVPGNLICYHGAVISQSADCLESFYQLDELHEYVERMLKDRPEDPQALALNAELALDAGRLEEALVLLRKSFGRDPNPRTRQLLEEFGVSGNVAAIEQ